MPDERMDRLPKWARDKITTLEMRNKELRASLAQLDNGGFDAPWYNVRVTDPRDERLTNQMPTLHRSVRFLAGPQGALQHRHFDLRLTETVGDLKYRPGNTLMVNGTRSLIVLPHSSNSIGIKLEDD